MKHKFIYTALLFIGILGLSACQNKKEKTIEAIKELEKKSGNLDEKSLQKLSDLYKDASELVDEDSSKAQLLMYSGHTMIRNNKNGDAITTFKQVLKKYPKTYPAGDAAFYTGFIYETHFQKTDSAIKYYEIFIKDYPENVMARDAKSNLELIKSDQNRNLVPSF